MHLGTRAANFHQLRDTTLVQPSNLLLLLLFLGSVLLIAGRRAAGTWLTAGATAALTIIGVLPVGAWLLLLLENRFSANPPLPRAIDGIIALGGGIDLQISGACDELAMDEAAERLLMLVTLGRRYPHARLAFTGGSGELFGRTVSEAAVVKQALRGLGADLERMVSRIGPATRSRTSTTPRTCSSLSLASVGC